MPIPMLFQWVIGVAILPITLVIYRLAFHPLARFPGPKLAAATKWYEFYFDVLKYPGGQFAEEIRKMHKVYGPIVRINPDELHVEDPEWYDTLYASNPTRRDKWPAAAKMAGTPLAGFGTVEHTLHVKRRAALSPMFSSRSITEAGDIIREQVEVLCKNFEDHLTTRKPMELKTAFIGFTLDTVSIFALGESMGLQNDVIRAKGWVDMIKAVSKTTPVAKQFPWLISLGQKIPLKFLQVMDPMMAGLLQIHEDMHGRASRYLAGDAITRSDVTEPERSSEAILPPVFEYIRASALPPSEKGVHRLAQEGFTVVVAGGETSARILAFGIFYIMSHLHVLRRLQIELDTAIPDASEIPPVRVLEDLTYLAAVVKESLRISAIPTSRFPLTTPGEMHYKGWVIPPTTPVGMTPHDVLLDPSVFEKPDNFDPVRWIQKPYLDRYLVTFGKGTRMCQGMKFAWAELTTAIAIIIRRFELELYETTKERDVDYIGDFFLGANHPDSPGIRVNVIDVRT
ncbi:MAG: hypothetical protein Q9213_001200 [Squamulea squamosa]